MTETPCGGNQRRSPPKYIENTYIENKSLEMYSEWRYKKCICSVILGELESFRNYKGFSVILHAI